MRKGVDQLGGQNHTGVDQGSPGPDHIGPPDRATTGTRDGLLRRLAGLHPAHPSSADYAARESRAGGPDGEPRSDAADRPRGGEDGGRPGKPPDEGPSDQPEGSYWSQVERFERLWSDHVRRWPDTPGGSGADKPRPGDPPGSWRGEGGRHLSPEQNAHADRLIGDLRAPEKSVSATLQRIERENTFGGHLAGFDHRLKGEQRLKEKIADGIKKELGSDVSTAVDAICDAVRYTFCFARDQYVSGYQDVRRRLESDGYQMVYGKNHWPDDPEYKGINTRWESADCGRFELQFHTFESLHAKEHLTHRPYERLRSKSTAWEERSELNAFQRLVGSAVPKPGRISEIHDFDGRI